MPEAVRASWSQLRTICRSESQRQTESFGPSVTHGWATPAKMRKKCCYGQKNLGQYVAVCLRLQLISHTQPTSTLSRIKCERYIFIKKCVRSFIEVVIIVDYVSAYICISMWLNNKPTIKKKKKSHSHQFCADIDWRLDDLLSVMDDRDGLWDRSNGIRAAGMPWWFTE